MKALVTGGAGFIGSHLVDLLIIKNFHVTVIDNLYSGNLNNFSSIKNKKNLKIIKKDITNYNDIEKHFKGIDYVFHLAGMADIVPSIELPVKYFDVNVRGTLNILEASKKYSIKKIIYAASSSCYGIPNKFPTNEKEIIDTQYPYALSKYLGEELILHWGKVYNINTISLRLFNVYGPRSRTSGSYGAMFGVFLAQKLAGKPMTIVGNGKQKRDFTYVSDVVNAFYLSAKKNVINTKMNVGSGKPYKVIDIANLIGGDISFIPKRPGEPDCTWANIDKIKTTLKWKPKVSIEKGIDILIKNIEYWKNAPVWDEKSIEKATKKWFEFLS